MDRRVRIIAELLHKQESLPPPSNLYTNGNRDEEDVKEILTIDKLARREKLSPGYLRALFKRDMKMTPDQFAKQLKMENAKKLAENSTLTVDQIVENVRGGDSSHFQREFKKTFGKTLGDFRRLRIQQMEEEQAKEEQEE